VIRGPAQETRARADLAHRAHAPAPAENCSAASTGRALLPDLVLDGDWLSAIAAATAATTATATPAAAFTVITATATAAAVVPTAATTVAAATAAAIAATATVTTAAATVATAAAAITTAAATEATAAAATARLTLLRLVHAKRPAVERTTIHPFDRLGGFLGGPHGHEGEAARAAGLTVRDQVDIADRSELLERRTYALCVGIER
jgi:hypothetical protein